MKKIFFGLIFFITLYAFAQDTVIMDSCQEEGFDIIVDTIEASSCLKDNSGYDYNQYKCQDGNKETAWCVSHGGIGEWIKFNFSDKFKEYYQFPDVDAQELNTLIIINGLAASEEIYYANNRIKKLKVEFDNGTSQIIELKDGMVKFQRFSFNTKIKWVKITILDIYKGKKYNDTCISEINFFTSPRKWKKK